MGGRRAPRECKVQYARDYKAVTLKAFMMTTGKQVELNAPAFHTDQT